MDSTVRVREQTYLALNVCFLAFYIFHFPFIKLANNPPSFKNCSHN